MRGYRMQGPIGSAFSTKWPGMPSELMWQISRFHSFLWASGGGFSDFTIHHIVTFEEFLNHEHEYAPNADKLTFDSPAPVQADQDGRYPVPQPGIKTKREY